jgi:hypothetical protein
MAPRFLNRLELDSAYNTVGRTGATREAWRPGCGWRRPFRWWRVAGGSLGGRAGARLGFVGRLPASPAPLIACPRFSKPLVHRPLCSTSRLRFAICTASSATSRWHRRAQAVFAAPLRAGIAPESARISFGAAPVPCGNHARPPKPHLGTDSCSNPLGVTRQSLFQPLKAASGNFWLFNVTGR